MNDNIIGILGTTVDNVIDLLPTTNSNTTDVFQYDKSNIIEVLPYDKSNIIEVLPYDKSNIIEVIPNNDNNISNTLPSTDNVAIYKKISTEELLLSAVYDNTKFRNLTRKFIEFYKTRDGLTLEEISIKYLHLLQTTIDSCRELFENKHGVQSLRKRHTRTVKELKQRWVAAAKKSLDKNTDTLLNKELKDIKDKYITNNGQLPLQGMNKPEDIIDMRLKELKEWSSSVLNPVSDYIYFFELSEAKALSAFRHDIILSITEVLQNDYDYDLKKIVTALPGVLAAGIFPAYKTGKRVNHFGFTKEGTIYRTKIDYTAKTMAGDEFAFGYDLDSTLLEQIDGLFNELANDISRNRATSRLYLDRLDLSLIRHLYTRSHEGQAYFKISNILKELKLAPTGDNYKRVREKLEKLPFYAFYFKKVDAEDYEKESFNLFSYSKVYKSNGELVAHISFSRLPALEKATTALMYKNELNKIQLDHSVDMAYFLEGQRRIQIENGCNLKDRTFRYEFEQLKMHMNFGKRKTIKEISEFIEEACIEIKTNQFILKEYRIGCGFIDVKFYEGVEKMQCLINDIILSLPAHLKESD